MAEVDYVNKVRFHYLCRLDGFPHRTLLKQFMLNLFSSEGSELRSLNVIFCSDEYLLQINRQYLNHDTYTDIITFDLSPSPRGPITAEIYISIDRVKENAPEYKTSWVEELHRVLFHGILHLCGYGDKSNHERTLMRLKEDYYLGRYKRCVSRGTRST